MLYRLTILNCFGRNPFESPLLCISFLFALLLLLSFLPSPPLPHPTPTLRKSNSTMVQKSSDFWVLLNTDGRTLDYQAWNWRRVGQFKQGKHNRSKGSDLTVPDKVKFISHHSYVLLQVLSQITASLQKGFINLSYTSTNG